MKAPERIQALARTVKLPRAADGRGLRRTEDGYVVEQRILTHYRGLASERERSYHVTTPDGRSLDLGIGAERLLVFVRAAIAEDRLRRRA